LESSLALGRVTLLRDQLRALSTQTATFSNMFKMTLKRVVTDITDLVENVMSPMSQKKVRSISSVYKSTRLVDDSQIRE